MKHRPVKKDRLHLLQTKFNFLKCHASVWSADCIPDGQELLFLTVYLCFMGATYKSISTIIIAIEYSNTAMCIQVYMDKSFKSLISLIS